MKLFSDRIFVYSPKGDIYDLPRGAFPLDYAYRIHSDIAAHASGFKVNGVMKPFNYELQHGDVVGGFHGLQFFMQIHQFVNEVFVHAAMGFQQGVFGLFHQRFFVLEVRKGAVNQVKQYD